MNSDLVEFYYKTKHAASISSREKEELERKQDEKVAFNLKEMWNSQLEKNKEEAKNDGWVGEKAVGGTILGGLGAAALADKAHQRSSVGNIVGATPIYHATEGKNVDSILKDGLNPDLGGSGASQNFPDLVDKSKGKVHVFADPEVGGMGYGNAKAFNKLNDVGFKDPKVISGALPHNEFSKFELDPEFIGGSEHAFRSNSTIPPSRLSSKPTVSNVWKNRTQDLGNYIKKNPGKVGKGIAGFAVPAAMLAGGGALLHSAYKEHQNKTASNFRQIASAFAKNHPKAVENAITGGILGGGSELVLPANKDMMGNPSTNLGEIGKRALLGATLGGIGGEVKTQVRNHVLPKIAQENTEKIASKLDAIKNFASNNAGALIGAGTLGGANAISGYNQEVPDTKGNFIKNSPKNRVLNATTGGLFGAVTGGLLGHAHDKVRTLKNSPKIKEKVFWPKVNKPMGKNASALDLLKSIPNSVRNGAAVKGIAEAGKQLAPSSLLQTAGKYMAKSPTVGGAVIGAGAGLTGNFLSGEDHAVGSALAGAGLGALGGKKLLVGNASKSPLFGQSFGTGVRNELKAGSIARKQNLFDSMKIPTNVNMGPTELAAINIKSPNSIAQQSLPSKVPNSAGTSSTYSVNTKGPVSFDAPARQSGQLQTQNQASNLKSQVSSAYKPTRSSEAVPSNNVLMNRPKSTFNPL